jgi:pilus assembly protein CpaF
MSMTETAFGEVASSDVQGWDLLLYYFKPLISFFEDPEVTEIMVNRFDSIWIERGGHLELTDATFGSEVALQELIFQVANRLNQQVDEDSPTLDARFPDGSRLCCTLPSVSPSGATITLRCKPRKLYTYDDLVGFGALTFEMKDYIGERVGLADAMLVTGNTGSGKTTVLRASAEFIDPRERVISAEDTAELHLKETLPGAVSLEAPKRRPKEGVPPVTLASLIKLMLRQRPDRGWVGEIRDAAAADAYLQLGNTGHKGSASSLHANGPEDAIRRLQYLLASAGLISYELAGHQILGTVQLIIHCSRDYKWGRKITHICRIENEKIIPVFLFNQVTGVHERVEAAAAA